MISRSGQQRKARKQRIAKGLCSECTNKALEYQTNLKGEKPKKPLCSACWVKGRLYHVKKNVTGWEILLARFVENPVCPYTGEELRLGDNVSLDHKYPKARFPELSTCIDNLEWVSWKANRSKQDMTPEEFRTFCKKVVENIQL